MLGLQIHKLADDSVGERVVRYDQETGERLLVNPRTGQPEPWPLKGVELLVAPDETGISTTLLEQGRSEGWISVEGENPVVRPGGPPEDRYRVYHTFIHLDSITFHTIHGDVKYKVVHQPDKYADSLQASFPDQIDAFEADDDTPVTDEMYKAGATRVDWWYGLKKVNQDA
jgi:hypothetical protein